MLFKLLNVNMCIFPIYIMKRTGVSIPDAVREIITRNRSVYDCMRMNIVNYSALAAQIREDVERETGRPANPNTIVVAIKRYADSFRDDTRRPNPGVLKNARLSITGSMLDIRLSAEELGMDPAAILSRFAAATDKYEFFRTADSVRFLAEDIEAVRQVMEEISGRRPHRMGLARIKVTIPPERAPPDTISYIAEILHSNGVELRNAFFSNDTTTLVLDERHAPRAYEILRSSITRDL